MPARYDRIGLTYSDQRKPDERIAKVIHDALGGAQSVLNVGAGTGSYEPVGRDVTAVEPSIEMIKQRHRDAAPVIQGTAEDLPFDDNSFDAAMAVLTIHHWNDQATGLKEMRRVTRGPVVILTYDPAFRGFWLTDYFPKLITLDEGQMPQMTAYGDWLSAVDITPVPIPHDCTDGFLSAYWRRPAAYLDPRVRAVMSPFWAIGDLTPGLEQLEADLNSGMWERQYGDLLEQESFDCGYRLVVAR